MAKDSSQRLRITSDGDKVTFSANSLSYGYASFEITSSTPPTLDIDVYIRYNLLLAITKTSKESLVLHIDDPDNPVWAISMGECSSYEWFFAPLMITDNDSQE